MPKKSILIIGAGSEQVPLIQAAKKMGLFVIGVDVNPQAEGFPYCDAKENIEIRDSESCLKLAEKLKVSAVVTSTEIGLETTAYICDKMRLFGNNLKEIIFLKNKFNQFKIFNKCKIPVIDTIRISSPEQGKKFNFPALIKPVDASAAKGVFLVKTFKELKKKFIESLRFSKKKHLLLQEYLRGKELGVEVIVQNKKIKGIYLTDKKTSQIPYFVVMGHEMPAQLTKDQKKIIHNTLLKIVKTLSIKNSMINFDLILVNNIVYVIEFGPRLGGNFLPLLVKLAAGGDNYKNAIKMALGIPTINYPCRHFSSIMYFNVRKKGTLTKIKYDEKLHRFTEDLKFFKNEGDSVKPVSEVNDRIGYFIVKAKNRYELKEKIKKVKQAVRFYLK